MLVCPAERKEEAFEVRRRCPGIGLSSASAAGGVQLGSSRRSNFEELESFHLRKTVQRTATPASEAATAIMIVIVVPFDWLLVAAAPVASNFSVELFAGVSFVPGTTTVTSGRLTTTTVPGAPVAFVSCVVEVDELEELELDLEVLELLEVDEVAVDVALVDV